MTEGSTADSERLLFSHWNGKVSVRTQQYRLDNNGKLFDITTDRGQQHDITAMHKDEAARLQQAVDTWKKELLPGLKQADRPFPIGHKDYAVTQLPARDAVSHGKIERSNKFPNCSYFKNWTSVDDSITWDVEVLEAGKYSIEIYYACSKQDIGSDFELSYTGDGVESTLGGKLLQPNDPPLIGANHDRVPRPESYVKDFKPWQIGHITLPAGRGTLKLRATNIPGDQAMEFRLIMLERVE